MDKSEYLDFCKIIYELSSVYRHDGGKMMDLYFQALKRLSLDEVKLAIEKWLQDPKKCAYLPKPGDLLAYFPEQKSVAIGDKICDKCNELPAEMHRRDKQYCMNCYHIHFWEPRGEYEIKFFNTKCRLIWEERLKNQILPG